MPSVKVREGESFERALRRFTKACERAGILSEYRQAPTLRKAQRKEKKEAQSRD